MSENEQPRTAHTVYLGLGSNLGDRKAHIRRAVEEIGRLVGTVERQSALYETEPWGYQSDNMYVNAVVRVSSMLSPRELLRVTQQIERRLGRRKKTPDGEGHTASARREYSDRPIDIDILLYDDLVVDEPDLKIPHPLMKERDFVMTPLREVCE